MTSLPDQNVSAHARAGKTYWRINVLLLSAALAVALLQFFIAPLFLPAGAGSVVSIVILCGLATPLHWGLMHESIHGNLFEDPDANRRAGRVLGWFLCLSWDVMRFGHLLHHSHNRHRFDRPEAVPPGASRLRAAGPYFIKLFGGHALISAVSSIALTLPFGIAQHLIPAAEPVGTAARRAFARRDRQKRIRWDLVATVLLLSGAAIAWSAHGAAFVATLGSRFVVRSLLDNAPHYGTSLDSGAYARNTRLPRFAGWLVMGHNFHGIHHGATGLKWHELRRAFVQAGACYENSWALMVLRQFRGPVYLD